MDRALIIDTAACVGKIFIENADVLPIIKDISKISIDIVSDYFKKNNSCDISSIRAEAARCGVEKIVAIPYRRYDNTQIILLRVYGGKQDEFFTKLRLAAIPKEGPATFYQLIDLIEEKHGLEIYRRVQNTNCFINRGD